MCNRRPWNGRSPGIGARWALLLAALAGPAAFAGPNANTTFVLHVAPDYGPCQVADPCAPGASPTVEITQPGVVHGIYFLVRNYGEISGLQADLAWPTDWTYLFEDSCPPVGLDCFHVSQHSIQCNFNCITGGATTLMAVIYMIPGSGCFEIVESVYPGGTCVVNCQSEVEPVAESNWGRVCVGPGGINACDAVVPVESATWGAIKSQYR